MALAAPLLMLNNHHEEEDVDNKRLTNEIFSILENKFLFGYHNNDVPPPPARGKVRILSIDAGGDAILAARTLLHFQSILRRKSGNPTAHIADFFDVVTGAGAGGILAGLLFTRAKDGGGGAPLLTAQESLQFIVDNCRKLFSPSSSPGVFRRRASSKKAAEKVLKKVYGDLTLKDTLKAVLIPCYDLRTGAPFLFSRADALEMDGCDFSMAGVCGATVADHRAAMELKSVDGTRKIVAVGGGVGMSNPTAAAITHVLNNKQEFPLCRGVEDLLVVSLGNCLDPTDASNSSPAQIAADGAADMVDQAVSMAFGEWRRSNYVRIQGTNGMFVSSALKKRSNIMSIVDEMLGQKNVESILFQGKKLVEFTNMEKLEMFAGEVIKEQHRRNSCINILPNVVLKHSNIYSPRRSSSATTLSTLSSC